MASYDIDPKSGRYHFRFDWGTRFKRSLKLADKHEADRVKAAIEDTIKDIQRGRLVIPEGAEPGAFILSGGKLAGKPTPAEPKPNAMTLGELFRLYDEGQTEGKKAATTRQMENYHKSHLQKNLGEDTEVDALAFPDVQRYVNKRSRQTWREKPITPTTISKELATLRVIWNWGRRNGLITASIPFQDKELDFQRTEEKREFQTYAAIKATIDRGGLTEAEQAKLWECLYLTLEEVHELLEYVRENAYHPFIHPMFVFTAMTGARRSEICASRIEDWRFPEGTVTIREKKRKRGRSSWRMVDINSVLEREMKTWLANHPGGQFAITKDGERLTVKMATDHFKRTLSKSERWKVIPGFHTLRHSFASILAAQGVDEPTIDRWMGHQTAQQRERYRHLFPKNRKKSIEQLVLPERQ